MQIHLAAETSPWAVQGLGRLTYTSDVDGIEDWAMMLPAQNQDAENQNENQNVWIINLHGHGSTGDQLYTRQDIRKSWLPHFIEQGYSVLSPNLRGNAWMSPEAVADLHALLNYLREHQNAKTFILASGSMGGTGNLIYATQKPHDVAGVVALCPATDLPSYLQWTKNHPDHPVIKQIHDAILQSYKHDAAVIARHSALAKVNQLTMPVVVIHGDDDNAIPVEQAQTLASALEHQSNFTYHQLPGGNHDAPLWHMAEALSWVRQRVK